MSSRFDVGTLVPFRPKGPLSIHPRTVRIAKGPPFLLSLTSFGCIACGTSLPISRPISASILGTSIPLRCSQRLPSSCVPIAAVESGTLGREHTTGSSIRFWLPISETSSIYERTFYGFVRFSHGSEREGSSFSPGVELF